MKKNIVSLIVDRINSFKRLKVENIFIFLENQDLTYTNKYVYRVISLLKRNGYIKVTSDKKKTNTNSNITLIKKIPANMTSYKLICLLKDKKNKKPKKFFNLFRLFS